MAQGTSKPFCPCVLLASSYETKGSPKNDDTIFSGRNRFHLSQFWFKNSMWVDGYVPKDTIRFRGSHWRRNNVASTPRRPSADGRLSRSRSTKAPRHGRIMPLKRMLTQIEFKSTKRNSGKPWIRLTLGIRLILKSKPFCDSLQHFYSPKEERT